MCIIFDVLIFKKSKIMRILILIPVILFFMSCNDNSQLKNKKEVSSSLNQVPTKKKENIVYMYRLNTGTKTKLLYEKTQNTPTAWIHTTTYKIINPKSSEHIITIRLTHFEKDNLIQVRTSWVKGGVLSEVNEQQINYQNKSLKPFGIVGDVKLLGGNSVPNQLMLQFDNDRFESVSIIENLGFSENSDFIYFLFNK